jgi:hypothetical protein
MPAAEDSLISIGAAHADGAVIDLTSSDSFLVDTNGPLKKRSKLKKLKKRTPEVDFSAKAQVEQPVDLRTEVIKHHSPSDTDVMDERCVFEENNERASPVDIHQQNVSIAIECNPTKPAPVKRKRSIETEVEGKTNVLNSFSAPPSQMPKKEEAKETETLGAEKKKNSKLTFQDKVLREMFVACKPFNINNLLAATQSSSESALEFALISLVDKKLILKKEFTSSKGATRTLYWANLDMANHKDAAQAIRVRYSDEDMAVAQKEYKEVSEQHLQIECAVESLLKEKTNEELGDKIKQFEMDICSMKERILKAIEFKENIQSKNVSSKVLKLRINKYRDEWKRRKEKVKNFLENLSDAMEKKEKDVVKMLDIETDEMVGVKLPPKPDVMTSKR